MQKLLFFVAFTFCLSLCGYAQQATPLTPVNTVSAGQSDLPKVIEGEIPANLQADMLAEMLLMNLVYTRSGEIHPTIAADPQILATAITNDSSIDAILREYIITGDNQIRTAREDELLGLY